MKVYKAQVTDNTDPLKEGKFSAYVPEFSKLPVKVTLTSPYYVPGHAGLIAVPPRGSEILVIQTEDTKEFFYLNSIVTQGESRWKDISDDSTVTLDEELYDAGNSPRRILFKTVLGHKILLSERMDEDGQDIKIEIQTAKGKRFLLSDSPDTDLIALINEEGDGIKISTEDVGTLPKRSVEIDTNQSLRQISREGQIDLIVQDGREINIVNKSTGSKGNQATPGRTGNLNLESENRDVNVVVKAENGRIFLKAKGGQGEVQIDSNGIITIHASQKMSLVTEGDLEIKGADVSLEAEGDVNIKAGRNLRISGAQLEAKADNTAAIDGQTLQLNGAIANAANSANPDSPGVTNYGD